MTLPVRSSTGCGGGCSPSESCPAPEPVTYEVTLSGGWNPAAVAEFLPLPALAFGPLVDTITPPPPPPVLNRTSFSMPVAAPADTFPADDAWQVVAPFSEATVVGMFLPLEFVPQAMMNEAFWLRYEFRDGDGCDSAVYVFFPDGLPTTAEEDVTFHVLYGPESEPIVVNVEAAPGPLEEGPQQDVVLTVSPTCPAPAAFVPVGPACGLDRIPVDAEVTFPDTPIPVVNPDSEGGPVPLAVEVVDVPDVPAVGFYQVDSSSGGGSGLRFEDVTWIEVRRTDNGTDPTDVKVWDQPSGLSYGVNLSGGETFEVPPVAGQTFGLNIAVSNAAVVQVAYR